LCYQTQKGLWNFSKISRSQHYPYSFPFFQNYKHPIYFFSFYHLPRLIILLLPKQVVGTNIFKIRVKNYVRKESHKRFEFTLLQRRRRKILIRWPMEGFNVWWLMEGFNVWWLMEGSNVWWPMEGEEKEKHLFTSSHFPSNKFYLNLHFLFWS
jgi:hypothetical protein